MTHYSDEEIMEIRKIFDKYDVNNNGLLEYMEFFRLVEELGQIGLTQKHSPEDIQINFDKVDKDDNGLINFEEFFDWLMK